MLFIGTFISLAKMICEYVDKEENDEGKLRQQLLEAQLNYEMDEISKEEYESIRDAIALKGRRIKEKKMSDDEE